MWTAAQTAAPNPLSTPTSSSSLPSGPSSRGRSDQPPQGGAELGFELVTLLLPQDGSGLWERGHWIPHLPGWGPVDAGRVRHLGGEREGQRSKDPSALNLFHSKMAHRNIDASPQSNCGAPGTSPAGGCRLAGGSRRRGRRSGRGEGSGWGGACRGRGAGGRWGKDTQEQGPGGRLGEDERTREHRKRSVTIKPGGQLCGVKVEGS